MLPKNSVLFNGFLRPSPTYSTRVEHGQQQYNNKTYLNVLQTRKCNSATCTPCLKETLRNTSVTIHGFIFFFPLSTQFLTTLNMNVEHSLSPPVYFFLLNKNTCKKCVPYMKYQMLSFKI